MSWACPSCEADEVLSRQVAHVVDEAKLHFEAGGIRSRFVDPANVAMAEVKLNVEAFDWYEPAESVIGCNLRRVGDILDIERDVTVEAEARPGERRLDLHLGSAEFDIACINPESVRQEPELPSLDLTTEVMVQRKTLEEIVAYADMVDKGVYIGFDHGDYEFYAEAIGDTDGFDYRVHASNLVDVKSSGDAHSRFSLDYLKDVVEAIPEKAIVRMEVGEEFPLKLKYEFGPESNGHVEYMQAPRIVSGD